VTVANAVHLLDEQAMHLRYIFSELKKRDIATIEPSLGAVEEYTRHIRTAPEGEALVQFFAKCTPGYFNGEGMAKRNEELFGGGRYGAGAVAFFEMLEAWRASGRLDGMELQRAGASGPSV
jgi:hypothetical protein